MRQFKSNTIIVIVSGLLVSFLICCQGGGPGFSSRDISTEAWPDESWQTIDRPEQLGWSKAKLNEAKQYSEKIGSAAVMIIDNGIVIDAWGDVSRNFSCHSMRKSLLSGLFGTYVAEGKIDLSKSLADLNINDYPNRLSEAERKATVVDLIKARSGIYIEALGESPDMKARRPGRHSHAPGTFWYYNNWDFNALGTIFEQETEQDLFESLDQQLATPLQMQDFDVTNCRYRDNNDYGTPGLTMHRYYDIRMSARDLARFGLLFLREGRWRDKQLLPREWVLESTTSHSVIGPNRGYGYMWWTGSETGLYQNVRLKGHSYVASGWRGHRMIVLPWRRLVVVHRVNTDQAGNAVENYQVGRLLWHILDAAGESGIGPEPTVEAAAGSLLNEQQLKEIMPGSTIRGPGFLIKMTPDDQFEFWLDGKKTDTGRWGTENGRFWLRSQVLTGGHVVNMKITLEGDRLKWFDRHGTLQGQGVIERR